MTAAAQAHGAAELRAGWPPGLVGELVRWHGRHYVGALGWPACFEAIVARELGELAAAGDPRVHAWSAWRGDEFLAGLVLDARRAETEGARLRFFVASDAARGHGVGTRLLRAATDCADAQGWPVWLTTVRGLDAAAHLYRKHGFVLADEHVDHSWGRAMPEQRYARAAVPAVHPVNLP